MKPPTFALLRIAWPVATVASDGCHTMAHGVSCRAADVCPCWHGCRLRYFQTGWFRSRWMCLCSVDLRKVTSGLALVNGNKFQRHRKRNDIISERDIQYCCPDRCACRGLQASLFYVLLGSCIPGNCCHAKVYKFIFYFFPINSVLRIFLTLLGCGGGLSILTCDFFTVSPCILIHWISHTNLCTSIYNKILV